MALAAAFLIAARMQRAIVSPLLDLTDLAERISAGRDYTLRGSFTSSDEVGVVVQAFNNMLDAGSYGADVGAGGSAGDALAEIERHIPDVIVSDIGMPHEDGYALIRRVRARAAAAGGSVPAIAVPAYASPHDRVAAEGGRIPGSRREAVRAGRSRVADRSARRNHESRIRNGQSRLKSCRGHAVLL